MVNAVPNPIVVIAPSDSVASHALKGRFADDGVLANRGLFGIFNDLDIALCAVCVPCFVAAVY